jgi:pyridoxal 5'-phosphate synthase pdxS subunit
MFTARASPPPPDAAMTMQLGADGVFLGSGFFKSVNPAQRAASVVKAATFYDDPDAIAKVSHGPGVAMIGINAEQIPHPHRRTERGW